MAAPALKLPAHSAPLGLAFYTGTSFPERVPRRPVRRVPRLVEPLGADRLQGGAGALRGRAAPGSLEDFATGFVEAGQRPRARPPGRAGLRSRRRALRQRRQRRASSTASPARPSAAERPRASPSASGLRRGFRGELAMAVTRGATSPAWRRSMPTGPRPVTTPGSTRGSTRSAARCTDEERRRELGAFFGSRAPHAQPPDPLRPRLADALRARPGRGRCRGMPPGTR